MASQLTIDLSTREEAGIDHVLARINAERAAETPPKPAITRAQYVEYVLREAIKSYIREAEQADAVKVETAYLAASATKQQQVRTVLGI